MLLPILEPGTQLSWRDDGYGKFVCDDEQVGIARDECVSRPVAGGSSAKFQRMVAAISSSSPSAGILGRR